MLLLRRRALQANDEAKTRDRLHATQVVFPVRTGEPRARSCPASEDVVVVFLLWFSCAEESDEDEDEENSEESVEDESEEDLTDTPRTPPTQPPYSLIPPPPVWVQHDQGLSKNRDPKAPHQLGCGCGSTEGC